MAFKNLFGCFRQVSAVATERFLLSQLAKTSQKSSQNPLKINLNSFLHVFESRRRVDAGGAARRRIDAAYDGNA